MAVSVTCRRIVRQGGKVYVRWADKTEQEFDSVADLRDHVRRTLEGEAAKDVLRAMAIAKWMQSSADGSVVTAIESKTVTLDLSLAANIVRMA